MLSRLVDPEKSNLQMIAHMHVHKMLPSTDHTLHNFDDVTIIKEIVSSQTIHCRIISLRLSKNVHLECVHIPTQGHTAHFFGSQCHYRSIQHTWGSHMTSIEQLGIHVTNIEHFWSHVMNIAHF